jgi:hypothetical protein
MLHLALRGELRRVPSVLYAKRYHDASVHGRWPDWPREELIALWAEQAATCARMALDHVSDAHDREVVLAAALLRVAGVGRGQSYATPKDVFEVAAASAMFCDAVGDTSPFRDMQSILAYPSAHSLRDAIAEHTRRNAGDAAPSLARRIKRKIKRVLQPE